MINGSDNLLKTVYLEENPGVRLPAGDSALGSASDSAWIIDHAVDSVLVGGKCAHDRILVLTDNYYDAWHVYVDGAPTALLRAYGSFRAAVIPAGTRQVLFKYHSQRYHTGKKVTALTSLYLVVILGFFLVRPAR